MQINSKAYLLSTLITLSLVLGIQTNAIAAASAPNRSTAPALKMSQDDSSYETVMVYSGSKLKRVETYYNGRLVYLWTVEDGEIIDRM